jgi:methanogenic corrinoid protein MtbC1
LDEALKSFDDQTTDVSKRLLPNNPYGRIASEYLLAVLEGDRRRASRVVLTSVNGADSVRDIYLQVLMPAQAELGRMWLSGEINVAEEHFASQTTKMVMAQLLPNATFQPPNGKTLLAAAVAGNRHDIGLQAVADFFEMAGWRTIQLGADVPVADLAEAVDCFEVDLVALSASLNVHLEALRLAIHAVRSSRRGDRVKILTGGATVAGWGSWSVDLGADAYASSADEAVRVGGELVGLTATGE